MRGMRWEAQVDWPTLSPSHSNEISGGGGKQREIPQTPLSHNILIGLHNIGKMQEVLMTLLKRISLHASDKCHQSAGLSVMHGLSIMTDHVLAIHNVGSGLISQTRKIQELHELGFYSSLVKEYLTSQLRILILNLSSNFGANFKKEIII